MIHTPYDGSSKPFTIGLSQLDIATWIDVDGDHDRYIAEKIRLYTEETGNVLAAEPGTEEAQGEVLELIESQLSFLRKQEPIAVGGKLPAIESEPAMGSRLRGNDNERWANIAAAGLLVQEDLVLMRKSEEGWRLVAASLCFPSAWNLHEKFGRPLHAIHQPVPGFGKDSRNDGMIERMFDNLRVDRPVLRWNWSIFGEARLYHPAPSNAEAKRFGDGSLEGKVVLRLERQTLRKLPKSGDILFTIRTYLDPVEVLKTHPNGATLALAIEAQLAAMTDEEVTYKGLVADRARLSLRLKELAAIAPHRHSA